MHVAGVAADAISRHVARLDYDFDELIVKNNEIPHEIRYGPETHPAYLPIVTATEQNKAQDLKHEEKQWLLERLPRPHKLNKLLLLLLQLLLHILDRIR